MAPRPMSPPLSLQPRVDGIVTVAATRRPRWAPLQPTAVWAVWTWARRKPIHNGEQRAEIFGLAFAVYRWRAGCHYRTRPSSLLGAPGPGSAAAADRHLNLVRPLTMRHLSVPSRGPIRASTRRFP